LNSPPRFGESERTAAARLIEIALEEDLAGASDLTCDALISPEDCAEVHVVARQAGVVAGLPIGDLVYEQIDRLVGWVPEVKDGSFVEPKDVVARVSGPLAGLLTGERTVLNFLTHLSGIATQTREYVEAVRGTKAVILDTRKTLPGWRALAKYAVRAGGGTNHRMGLYDGVLVKDNHIAAWSQQIGNSSLVEAVKQARESAPGRPVEFEVDTLDQFRDVLKGRPDIVLLDNMSTDQLREAVQIRDGSAPDVLLEASGGVSLQTVRSIAETGIDRISIGALTHTVPNFDLGFDFHRAA
jgi:nicotinate-nucleotide pyrophosphorylase (carboxylating)